MNDSQLAQETDELDSIMEQLDLFNGRLPVGAIQAARRNKAKIIPLLIESIRLAIDKLRNREVEELHIRQVLVLAFFLLLEFRASEALPVILEGIKLPGEGPRELFGDIVTETLPRALVILGEDQALEISIELFRDTKVFEYVRWSAIQVPIILAATGTRPRVEMVALCRLLLREALDKKDRVGVNCIVAEILELNPWEAADEIKEAFDRKMVDRSVTTWSFAQLALQDKPLQIDDPHFTEIHLDDCVKELKTWHCFSGKDEPAESFGDDESAEAELSEELESIIEALDQGENKFPVEAIQAARLHKAAIIPKLIERIRQATDAMRDGKKEDGNSAFLALFLLFEFRATEALPAVLDAFSLPDDGPFDLFGDAIHEYLPRILIVLGQDRAAEVCAELARNVKLNLYVRWSALSVPVVLVATGLRPRDEMMSLYKQLLREAMEQKDQEIVTSVIVEMHHLNPWELAQDIRDAFAGGLVDQGIIHWDDVKDHLQDKPMEDKHGRFRRIYLDDVVAALSGWACFQEQPKAVAPAASPLALPTPRQAEQASPKPEPAVFTPPEAIRNATARVGRNEPCPCGSGQKFKRCCGGRQG